MILFDRAATAAKALVLVAAVATLAACADNDADDGTPAATSGNGGSSSTGGAGGAGAEGGSGGENPCGEDCSVYGPPGDPCYVGVCNTGDYPGPINVCAVVSAPKDTPCEDGLYCTTLDYCNQGKCIGGPANTCDLTLVECGEITCDEASQSCSQAPADEGSICILGDGAKCEVNGKCTGGECVGVPKDCSFSPLKECNTVACNPDSGLCEGTADAAKDGAVCSLTGELCNDGRTCLAGDCQGGTPKDCSSLTVGCNNGVCDTSTGFCAQEPVAEGDACAEGNDECNDGICDSGGTCVPTPKMNGTACNDFSTCTESDSCASGICEGSPVAGCNFYLESSFETCPENWTLVPDWECGTPTKTGGPGAHGGQGVLATKLDVNYTNGWEWNENIAADSPVINLNNAVAPQVSFWGWFSTQLVNDGVNMSVSTDNGATWVLLANPVPAYTQKPVGTPTAASWGGDVFQRWRRYLVDLTPYAGQQIKLRFQLRTDGSTTLPGAFIDDLVVAEPADIPLVIDDLAIDEPGVGAPYAYALRGTGGGPTKEWSIVASSNAAWLAINPTTGVLSGPPTAADLGPASVTVRLEDPAAPNNFWESTYDFETREQVYATSFEGACPAGWTLAGEFDCGTPMVTGPATAHTGTQVLATSIGTTYPNGINWGSTTATSPTISLAGATSAKMRFYAWTDDEGKTFDGWNVKVSANGAAFVVAASIVPAYPLTVSSQAAWGGPLSGFGWQRYEVNLTPFVGGPVQVRIDFRSDVSNFGAGVYIDDVVVLK